MSLTTKFIKGTKSRIPFTKVFINGVFIGQIWDALPIIAPKKYCACTPLGANQAFLTMDQAINFLATKYTKI